MGVPPARAVSLGHEHSFPWDGWQDFRFRGMLEQTTPEGVVEGMRTSTGLHAFLSNGNTVNSYDWVSYIGL
jgi:hypothetical protein